MKYKLQIAFWLAGMMVLTGCGGEYDTTMGKEGTMAVSKSAIDGGIVSGSAVSGQAIRDDRVKSDDGVQMQDIYEYCNSRYMYVVKDGMLEQRTLEGKLVQTFSLPGVTFQGMYYDEDCDEWVEVEAVAEDEIIYKIDRSLDEDWTASEEVPMELWSVPLKQDEDGECLDADKAEKVLALECSDLDVCYADTEYIAMQVHEGGESYREFNRKEKKYVNAGFQGKNAVAHTLWYYGGKTNYNQVLLTKEKKGYSTGIYLHTVGSGKVEQITDRFRQYLFDDWQMWNLYMDTENQKIYYSPLSDRRDGTGRDVQYDIVSYDLQTKEETKVLEESQWKKKISDGEKDQYALTQINADSETLYLVLSEKDFADEGSPLKVLSYGKEDGIKEEKKLNEWLQEKEVYDVTFYLGRCYYDTSNMASSDKIRHYVYDFKTQENREVKEHDMEYWCWGHEGWEDEY